MVEPASLMDDQQRFVSEVRARLYNAFYVDPVTGCWVWKGAPSRGYGYMNIRLPGEDESKKHVVSRVVYQAFVCEIPEGHEVDHKCKNRLCINWPEHLEAVTKKVNLQRAHTKTECVRGHPLSGDNVVILKRGERRCKTCHSIRQQNYTERKKAA